jgi:hypothetical protein
MERTAAVLQEMSDNRRDDIERGTTQEKGFNKLSTDRQAFLLAVGSQDMENPLEILSQSGLDLLKLSQKNAATSLLRSRNKERDLSI